MMNGVGAPIDDGFGTSVAAGFAADGFTTNDDFAMDAAGVNEGACRNCVSVIIGISAFH